MKYIILPERLSYSPVFSVEPAPVTSLFKILHEIPDPRRAQGKRHPLPIMLTLAILAMCSGANSYQAIKEWAVNYQDRLQEKLPFLSGHTPDASTFHRLFCRLDVFTFERILGEWMQEVVPVNSGEGIALDGKTACGSGFHLVAAFTHIARSVLFQEGATIKGKELVVEPKVLKQIPVKDHIVTGDAMFAQKNICKLITNRGGGFVFTVKDNQKTLKEDIKSFFADTDETRWDFEIDKHKTIGKQKGRVEHRTVEATSELNEYIDWPGVTHTWRCTRIRDYKGKTTKEVAYGIARLLDKKNPASQLNKLIRGHWQIENRCFRQRDIVFGEDKCTIRKRNAPQIMAALRNLITTIFHRGCVRSFTIAQRRFAARPEELFAFLGLPAYVRAYAV